MSTTTDEKLAAMIRRLSEQGVAMVALISDITQAGVALEKRVATLEQNQDDAPASRQEG